MSRLSFHSHYIFDYHLYNTIDCEEILGHDCRRFEDIGEGCMTRARDDYYYTVFNFSISFCERGWNHRIIFHPKQEEQAD